MNEHSSIALERYIKKVLEIQEQNQSRPISKTELQAIENELQLTELDKAIIEQEFKGHFERGIGFMKFRNWETATKELEQAYALKPYHENTLIMLAAVYKEQFRISKKPEYRTQALDLANQCLYLNTQNDEAYKIISDLEAHARRAERMPSKKRRRKSSIISKSRNIGKLRLPSNRVARNVVFVGGLILAISLIGSLKAIIGAALVFMIVFGLVVFALGII